MNAQITEEQYLQALKRLEQIFQCDYSEAPESNSLLSEYKEVADIVRDYEELHYPIELNWIMNLKIWLFGLKYRFYKFFIRLRLLNK